MREMRWGKTSKIEFWKHRKSKLVWIFSDLFWFNYLICFHDWNLKNLFRFLKEHHTYQKFKCFEENREYLQNLIQWGLYGFWQFSKVGIFQHFPLNLKQHFSHYDKNSTRTQNEFNAWMNAMRILLFYPLSAFISTNSPLQIASNNLFDRNSKQWNILTTSAQQFNTLITHLQKLNKSLKRQRILSRTMWCRNLHRTFKVYSHQNMTNSFVYFPQHF